MLLTSLIEAENSYTFRSKRFRQWRILWICLTQHYPYCAELLQRFGQPIGIMRLTVAGITHFNDVCFGMVVRALESKYEGGR